MYTQGNSFELSLKSVELLKTPTRSILIDHYVYRIMIQGKLYEVFNFVFRIKTSCSLIDFDVKFPMQSSELINLLNFGIISK